MGKGTQTRIKEHAVSIKEYLHAQNKNQYSLVVEFIQEINPEKDPEAWQQFKTPQSANIQFKAWVGGSNANITEIKPETGTTDITDLAQLSEEIAITMLQCANILKEDSPLKGKLDTSKELLATANNQLKTLIVELTKYNLKAIK